MDATTRSLLAYSNLRTSDLRALSNTALALASCPGEQQESSGPRSALQPTSATRLSISAFHRNEARHVRCTTKKLINGGKQ